MNKKLTTSLFAAVLSTASLNASVALGIEFLELRGTGFGVGDAVALVADTTGNGFVSGASLSGLTLSAGQMWAGDDQVLYVGSAADIGGPGLGLADAVNYSYSGNFAAGDALQVYWFTAHSPGQVISTGLYGSYRNATVDAGAGADTAFIAPTDGGSWQLSAYDTTWGGLGSVAEFTATTAIPEPSTYAGLFGLAALGLAYIRRRK